MDNKRFMEILGLEVPNFILFSNNEIFNLFKACFEALERICPNKGTQEDFIDSLYSHKSADINDIADWLKEEGFSLMKNILLTPIKKHSEATVLVERNKFILNSGIADALEYQDYRSFYLAFLDTIYGIDDKIDFLKKQTDEERESILLADVLDINSFKEDFWVDLSDNSHLLLPPAQKAGFFMRSGYN